MDWPVKKQGAIAVETHFDGRAVACYKDRPHSVEEMLETAVAHRGQEDALICGEIRLSYDDLEETVACVAAQLHARGVKPGDRVALILSNCAEFVFVLLAAARLGAITVPVNVREQTPELSYILNHCSARVLVHSSEVTDRLPRAEDIKAVDYRFVVGAPVRRSEPFGMLLEVTSGSAPEKYQAHEEEVAVILYTSGTTGRPKGAMLTHFNIVHSCMHYRACMDLTAEDRSVMAVPASHVTGVIANILSMIHAGGCTVILPTFDVFAFLELASAERMTHTILVPAMYNLCLRRADLAAYDLRAWRVGGYGGAPMPEATIAALAQELPNLGLMNIYGSTEVTSPACTLPPDMTAKRPDSIGLTVPCGDIRIVRGNGEDAEPGEAGEIWIGGPMVVPGYWDNPEKTKTSFERGYWKSGDIGTKDAEGFIRIHDRIKDMIIRGGYNIYSAEIENTLTHHPHVEECAAIGREDPVLGEKTHVFVRASSDQLSEHDVRAFCAERLADYKIPDFVTFLDGPLPRNANGKVLKNALRAYV